MQIKTRLPGGSTAPRLIEIQSDPNGPAAIGGDTGLVAAHASGPAALTLAWPASVYGFRLQATTNLNGGASSEVSATLAQTNNLNQVTVPAASGTQFFRLALKVESFKNAHGVLPWMDAVLEMV